MVNVATIRRMRQSVTQLVIPFLHLMVGGYVADMLTTFDGSHSVIFHVFV